MHLEFGFDDDETAVFHTHAHTYDVRSPEQIFHPAHTITHLRFSVHILCILFLYFNPVWENIRW